MASGFRVTLGDETIDPGDDVANDGPTTYTSDAFLGRGSVRWANGGSSFTASGNFYQDEDGNVYFEPDAPPSAGALGGTAEVVSFSGTQPSTMLCFLAGTLIATPQGQRRVEDLSLGDFVCTHSGGAAPIFWIGSRHLSTSDALGPVDSRPIEISTSSGRARLRVSPQHGVKVETDKGPLLVRAKHLADFRMFGARRMNGKTRNVSYHHVMLPSHAMICADGIWCESFWPGPLALASLSRSEADVIRSIIAPGYGEPVLNYATRATVRGLAAPHGSGRRKFDPNLMATSAD